ncbi:MAG: alginate export family protein [Pseudomonadota bacterium]|nr:alginate export family protein [Pseudomonadota bacterium]
MRLIALIVPVVALSAQVARADDGLSLSGSVRVRYEAIENQARVGFDRNDDLFNVRTILAAEYRQDSWRIGGELWDSRVYLQEPGTPVTTGEVNTFELVSAYVATDIAAPFGPGSKLTLKAGRSLLNLGSRRLVAADDYRNTTNSYTGLRADLTLKSGLTATAIYVLPQSRRPDDPQGLASNRVAVDRESFDLVLWGGLVAKPQAIGRTMAEVSFFHLGERDAPGRPSRDRSLNTLGLRLIRDPKAGQFDHEVEVIGQWGRASTSLAATAPRKPVRAWFAHADAGYTFPGALGARLSLEFDYASGDSGGAHYGRFDTLFGMRRADLAPAGLYNSIARANIVTPGVRFEAAPSKRLDFFASYRAMWLASATDAFATTGVRDPLGRAGRFAGHQLESRVRWWAVPKRLQLEIDALTLIKGSFLRRAPNAPAGGDTRYVSFNATAHF